jgi:hypothetical protein
VTVIPGDSLTHTRTCQRAGCNREGTDHVGRWVYCQQHSKELRENRRSRQTPKPLPALGRPGPYERRVLTLIESAVKLDEELHAETMQKMRSVDAADEWRRRVRALAYAEGLVG